MQSYVLFSSVDRNQKKELLFNIIHNKNYNLFSSVDQFLDTVCFLPQKYTVPCWKTRLYFPVGGQDVFGHAGLSS